MLVTHDEGAVEALNPERVLLMPDGDEDLWNDSYLDLVAEDNPTSTISDTHMGKPGRIRSSDFHMNGSCYAGTGYACTCLAL